ncbi:hemerythrin domain-containing protein [Paenibacillus sp. DXFW5]|uniref:Hemerythrin domain-containing protein n=1 Tax=Paenibacillus rhizolycopersici TaxID=2780073 RepID=A0ABS2HA35_9BACL|nr:hemerythrin domain-containing protein [Paenibacillus rhizolycopersici]MBM6997698.1 hemerythrin domain-containing protein [Paenibacillus rhizolycopersici]
MRSGPSLRNVDSHALIHEAVLEEAKELTELLARCLSRGETDKALDIAWIAVEHWESRTLQHAQSEEEGLYVEALELKPQLKDVITALTRDHQLLRELVAEIRDCLERGEVGDQVVYRFQALILVDQLHNRYEEDMVEKEMEAVRHDASSGPEIDGFAAG